ncbi:MAG: ABC transporter permease, partial [Turicibacter sp.]
VTVFISCRKPAKVAGAVSPIEALRYTSVSTSQKHHKKGVNGSKIHKMAWSNLMNQKKKVFISLLSISLSSALFVLVINIFMGFDPVEHTNRQMFYDIEIWNEYYPFSGSDFKPITKELVEEISNLEVVKEVKSYYMPMTIFKDETFGTFDAEIINEGLIKEEFESYPDPDQKWTGFNYSHLREGVRMSVVGMNPEDILKESEKLKVIDGKIDTEKFKTGAYIILRRDEAYGVIKAGDELPMTFVLRDEFGEEALVTKTFKVMAIMGYVDGWTSNNLGMFTIPEQAFKSIYPNSEDYIWQVGVTLNEEANLKEASDAISKIIFKSGNEHLFFKSKYQFLLVSEEMKWTYTSVGMVVASIFGFIGILNVINSIITGIFARKLELSMLEAIGMTKKQIKKMLTFEGLYYTLLALGFVVPLGFIASLIAPYVMPIYGSFKVGVYLVAISAVMVVITILMLSIPNMLYRKITEKSIVERLREIE